MTRHMSSALNPYLNAFEMKKLIPLICLSLFCLAASAQPTSFGEITPGKTTREELKSLVKKPGDVGSKDYFFNTELKQPAGVQVSGHFENDVVYTLSVSFFDARELKQALIEKYGNPPNQFGSFRRVMCRNILGAFIEGLAGKEERRWLAKDGVQGVIKRSAYDCSPDAAEVYELRHLATIQALEDSREEQARKAAEEKRRKLGNAY